MQQRKDAFDFKANPFVHVKDVVETQFIEPRHSYASEIVQQQTIDNQQLLDQTKTLNIISDSSRKPSKLYTKLPIDKKPQALSKGQRFLTVNDLLKLYYQSIGESKQKTRLKNIEDFVEFVGHNVKQCDPLFIVIQFAEYIPLNVNTFAEFQQYYERILREKNPIVDQCIYY